MRRIKAAEQLKRASNVIKTDRMGVSTSVEGLICKEVEKTLSEFFALMGEVKTEISVVDRGFNVKITANAKSIKQLKIID